MSDTAHITYGMNVIQAVGFCWPGASTILGFMLTLIEHTPIRAVFEERRPGLRAGALICLGLTLFALTALASQWRSVAEAYPDRVTDPAVLLGGGAFVILLLLFGAASLYALFLSRRMTLTLDREAGDIVIVAPRGMKMVTETLPYYGIKAVRLTGSPTQKALALVFVLRDGRVVPVTAAPLHDQEKLEALAAHIQQILRDDVTA